MVVFSLSLLFLIMEPVLFNKVFVNDDEWPNCVCMTSRPYQEILQVMSILTDDTGYSHGDHSRHIAKRSMIPSYPISLFL